jgi:hypothetical protein
MILQADPIRGKNLADLLYYKFLHEGILGRTAMPGKSGQTEHLIPE